jgi:hypothetical protein
MSTTDTNTASTSKQPASIEDLPGELMNQIVDDGDAGGYYTINLEDLISLHSISHRVQQTTLDEFAQRYFTTRKYMLSRHSLQCLLDIANHPRLSSYVREVAIGPERINSDLKTFLGTWNPADPVDWLERFSPKYVQHVQEQKQLNANNGAVTMLGTAFKAFENLQHIRIDCFPDTASINDES